MQTFGLGWADSLSYTKRQASFIESKETLEFDNITNSIVLVPNFSLVLNTVNCPTLAIFGEKDYVVDWKTTKALYESTLKKNLSTKYTSDNLLRIQLPRATKSRSMRRFILLIRCVKQLACQELNWHPYDVIETKNMGICQKTTI